MYMTYPKENLCWCLFFPQPQSCSFGFLLKGFGKPQKGIIQGWDCDFCAFLPRPGTVSRGLALSTISPAAEGVSARDGSQPWFPIGII